MAALFGGTVYTVVSEWQSAVGDSLRHLRNTFADVLLSRFVAELLLNPWFYAVLVLVLALERLIPAQEQQSSVTTRGARQDMLWVIVKIPAFALFLPAYAVVLHHIYDRYLGGLTVEAARSWPEPFKVIFAFLLGDLTFWFSHLVRHKLRFLWQFHAIHHSQREMNFFSEYRTHPVDDLFVYTINFIPLFMFEQGLATVMAVVWIMHWHTRLYHANIRSNFGWLRFILVTPQSHRVHHSIEPRHQDKNFGLTLSIWDHLFGTQHRQYNEYPETGVDDPELPMEQDKLGLRTLVAQLIYPFAAGARRG